MAKVQITAIGAATLDTFLIGEAMRARRDVRTHDYVAQFPLGEKLEVEDVIFSTGGGASNAAVTFARQGLKAKFVGQIGDDLPGREIIAALRTEGVDISDIAVDLEATTGYSTILLTPSGERTILVYRGAAEELAMADIKLGKWEGEWLYMSSLAGNLSLLAGILKYAKQKKITVAFNPGGRDLAKAKELRKLLSSVTVLILNQDELVDLFGGSSEQALHAASTLCPYVVMTDGPKGSWLVHASQLYHAGMYKDVKVKDRTGAGDAFGSGLVAALAQSKSVEEALTLAAANATSVVSQIGAKVGILHAGAKLKTLKIRITDFGP